jgi:hypothetical protein
VICCHALYCYLSQIFSDAPGVLVRLESQPSRQALETVWEVESESEAWDTRDYEDLTVDSRKDELFVPLDGRLRGGTRIVQSGPYATSKNDYFDKTEKFEKIMEQMERLLQRSI